MLIKTLLFCTLLFFICFTFHHCAHPSEPPADEEKVDRPPTVERTGQPAAPCTDANGNTYSTITIGTQTWMAEDLRLTAARCDSTITLQFTNGIERGPGVPFYDGKARYAFYNNDRKNTPGALYSYAATQQCQLCPKGYRIPTKTDWETLIGTLGGKGEAGKQLLPNGSSGFEARPGGRIDDYGSVLGGNIGFWWSSTPDSSGWDNYTFELRHDGLIKLKPQDNRVGNAVRCIKK